MRFTHTYTKFFTDDDLERLQSAWDELRADAMSRLPHVDDDTRSDFMARITNMDMALYFLRDKVT